MWVLGPSVLALQSLHDESTKVGAIIMLNHIANMVALRSEL